MYVLKPCPFCGKEGTADIDDVKGCEECKNFEDESCPAHEAMVPCPFHVVVCSCYKGGCGAATGWKLSIEEAVKAWNTRA